MAVVSLTGLGLKASSLIVGAAGGSVALAAIYSAVAVLVLGLAVPVTASFIISAVIVGPALIALGVGEEAAYMFIFYFAVLSEVSPPTALSSVAAAAITGGDAFKTMMLTLRYTLPAFLVPFAFVLSPNGEGLLLQGPILQIAWTLAVAALAVVALAVATGGWLLGPARPPERVLAGLASLFLLYLEPLTIAVGVGLLVAAVVVHLTLRRTGVLTQMLVVLVAAVAGCGSGGDGQRLSIATGGSGGVYFVYGGGLAEQIGEHLDGYQATAEVTSAWVDNMYLIAGGKGGQRFTLADTAADAVNGTDTFDGERVQAQALARLYNNLTQVATVEGKGITSVEDLRGKRVSVSSPGRHRGDRLQVLEAAGLDSDDRLVAVASPSEAALDYELEGRRRTDAGGWRLEPAATPAWTPCRWSPPLSAAAPGGGRAPAAAVPRGWRPGPPRPQRPLLTAWPGSAGLEGAAVDGAVDRRLGDGADGGLVVGGAGLDRLLEADRADPDPLAADVVEDGLALVGAAGAGAGVGDPEHEADLVLAAGDRAEHGHGGHEGLALVGDELDHDRHGGEGEDGHDHHDQAGGAEDLPLAAPRGRRLRPGGGGLAGHGAIRPAGSGKRVSGRGYGGGRRRGRRAGACPTPPALGHPGGPGGHRAPILYL